MEGKETQDLNVQSQQEEIFDDWETAMNDDQLQENNQEIQNNFHTKEENQKDDTYEDWETAKDNEPKPKKKNIVASSKIEEKTKQFDKIYVDGLNYMEQFLDMGSNSWDIQLLEDRITKLCQLFKQKNYEIMIFIDAGYSTQQTIDKFKKRTETCIHNANRLVPYNLSDLLGNAFEKNGVKVHYSLEDNDDTLAAFAYRDQAAILSRDQNIRFFIIIKDFWRYEPQPLEIIKNFYINSQNQIEFELQTRIQTPKNKIRHIPKNIQKTSSGTSSFSQIRNQNFKQLFGSPSCLTRYLGNPQLQTQELRASLYYSFGVTQDIEETISDWNKQQSSTFWNKFQVTPNDKYLKMLQNEPIHKIFQEFFPKSSEFRKRPINISDMSWNNHLNSLLGLICEIKQFFVEEQNFTSLMKQYMPEKLFYFKPLQKPDAYKYICKTCKTVVRFDNYQFQKLQCQKRQLPKSHKSNCNDCQRKLYGEEQKLETRTQLNEIIQSKIIDKIQACDKETLKDPSSEIFLNKMLI